MKRDLKFKLQSVLGILALGSLLACGPAVDPKKEDADKSGADANLTDNTNKDASAEEKAAEKLVIDGIEKLRILKVQLKCPSVAECSIDDSALQSVTQEDLKKAILAAMDLQKVLTDKTAAYPEAKQIALEKEEISVLTKWLEKQTDDHPGLVTELTDEQKSRAAINDLLVKVDSNKVKIVCGDKSPIVCKLDDSAASSVADSQRKIILQAAIELEAGINAHLSKYSEAGYAEKMKAVLAVLSPWIQKQKEEHPDVLKEKEKDGKDSNSKKVETDNADSEQEKLKKDLKSQADALDKVLLDNGLYIECPAVADATGKVVCKAKEDLLVAAIADSEKLAKLVEGANAMEKFLAGSPENAFEHAKEYRVELNNVIKRLNAEVEKNKGKADELKDKENKDKENQDKDKKNDGNGNDSQLTDEQKAINEEVNNLYAELKTAGFDFSCATDKETLVLTCTLTDPTLASVASNPAAIESLLAVMDRAQKRLTELEPQIQKSNLVELLHSTMEALKQHVQELKSPKENAPPKDEKELKKLNKELQGIEKSLKQLEAQLRKLDAKQGKNDDKRNEISDKIKRLEDKKKKIEAQLE